MTDRMTLIIKHEDVKETGSFEDHCSIDLPTFD
jgi:hypothetical protein